MYAFCTLIGLKKFSASEFLAKTRLKSELDIRNLEASGKVNTPNDK
jgi:hypothetical protein